MWDLKRHRGKPIVQCKVRPACPVQHTHVCLQRTAPSLPHSFPQLSAPIRTLSSEPGHDRLVAVVGFR